MNAIVIEHVSVAELPEKWRAKLAKAAGATVTVRGGPIRLNTNQATISGTLPGCHESA